MFLLLFVFLIQVLFSPFHSLRFTLSVYSALIIQISSLTFYVPERIESSPKRDLKIQRFTKSVNCVKTNTHNQIQRTVKNYLGKSVSIQEGSVLRCQISSKEREKQSVLILFGYQAPPWLILMRITFMTITCKIPLDIHQVAKLGRSYKSSSLPPLFPYTWPRLFINLMHLPSAFPLEVIASDSPSNTL